MENLTNPLKKEYCMQICKIGQGNSCCRYLVGSPKGFECAKHTSIRSNLDRRVANNTIVAQGDNCDGVKTI